MAKHSEPKMTGAQCLIRALEDAGVDVVFGYPGGHALDIYDALYDSDALHHVLVRHEQGAVHAADGYARATGKAGTVIVTSGPGATNTVTGIATAYMDSIPLVVITGQVPTDALGSDAFQESDMTGITLPIVKHSYLVKDAADIPETIAQAYHIASTGRPGPVVIDIPSNLAREVDVTYSYPAEVKLPSYKPTYKGNSRQVKQAARAIEKAQRPVIYAGGGVIASGATPELAQLAESMQIPVATTLTGKGGFPEDSPLNLGMLGIYGLPAANETVHKSDLVLAVGTRFANRSTGDAEGFAPHAQIIHIDIDPAEIGKNHRADIPIVGDVKTVLAALIEELRKDDARPQTSAWLEDIARWKCEQPHRHMRDETTVRPEQVMMLLDELTKDRDTIFTTDVGQHQMWASQLLHTTRPRSFVSSGGAGTMGFGLPAAAGAQLACPDNRVVCVTGDGSLQMNIQEMATIRANDLPVKVLLIDNNCLGMVRQMQEQFHDQRYSQTLFTGNPDFVALARAYGWDASKAEDAAKLEDAMKQWLACEGPALLWVPIAGDEDVYPKDASDGTAKGVSDLQDEE